MIKSPMEKRKVNKEQSTQFGEAEDFPAFLVFLNSRFKKEDKEQWESLIEHLDSQVISDVVSRTIEKDLPLDDISSNLKDLKTKGFLDQLEPRIGAANYLKLLQHKGTFAELVAILKYSSTAMAAGLIEKLTHELSTQLIDRTITMEQSIYNILRDLRVIKHLCGGFGAKFEKKIGIDNILGLLLNNGSLGVISNLIENLPFEEIDQLKIVPVFNSLSEEDKDLFISRGDFFEFCSAVTFCPQLEIMPSDDIEARLQKREVVSELLRKAAFKNINRGIGCLTKLHHKENKDFLLKLVADYMAEFDIKDVTARSVSERIAYLSIFSRLDKLSKEELEALVKDFKEEDFLEEKDFISSLQLLEHIVTICDIDPFWREEILTLANSEKILKKLPRETALNAFLYLWNTYALYINEELANFNQWINPEIAKALLTIVERYRNAGTNTEGTRHLLMLLGLMTYLKISMEELQNLFPKSRKLHLSKDFLVQLLGKSSFITGYFYLRGVEFIVKRPLFPNKWKLLTPTLYELEVKTKGLQQILKSFQRKIGKREEPQQKRKPGKKPDSPGRG